MGGNGVRSQSGPLVHLAHDVRILLVAISESLPRTLEHVDSRVSDLELCQRTRSVTEVTVEGRHNDLVGVTDHGEVRVVRHRNDLAPPHRFLQGWD